MKKLAVVLGVWLGLALVIKLSWDYYTSPIRIAEQITGLDLPSNAASVKFTDGYSFFLGGGITCGELAVDDRQIVNLMKQAEQRNYMLNLEAGQGKLLTVLQQSGCCQDTSVQFGNVPGRYKTLQQGSKESAYVLIDSLHRRVYFFRAIASPMF
jgi:hypothetical protein